MILKLKMWLIRRLIYTMKYPVMISHKDHWIFVDTYYDRIWKIKYTGRPNDPFRIELMEQ